MNSKQITVVAFVAALIALAAIVIVAIVPNVWARLFGGAASMSIIFGIIVRWALASANKEGSDWGLEKGRRLGREEGRKAAKGSTLYLADIYPVEVLRTITQSVSCGCIYAFVEVSGREGELSFICSPTQAGGDTLPPLFKKAHSSVPGQLIQPATPQEYQEACGYQGN